MKGLLNFYLSRKQMPFLKEQKQKAKLARNCLKCKSWVSKLNNFLGVAHHIPRGCPPSHTYSNLALCAKMAAPPPFLVPAIASVVLAISNLNKNPDAIHMYFTKETLPSLCGMRNEKKCKSNLTSHHPQNPVIIQAIIG